MCAYVAGSLLALFLLRIPGIWVQKSNAPPFVPPIVTFVYLLFNQVAFFSLSPQQMSGEGEKLGAHCRLLDPYLHQTDNQFSALAR